MGKSEVRQKGVSRKFQRCFIKISRKVKVCIKKVSRVFKKLKVVSGLNGVSRLFQERFKGV